MTLQVEKLAGQYVVVLSEEQMRELSLTEGSPVALARAEAEAPNAVQYASTDEVMRLYKQLEPRWAGVFAELAK